MSSKADFNLVVGAEISASYEEMRKDLKVIINTLNKQPYKIKLGLDMASASKDVNKLKTDISELSKSAANIKFSDQISNSLNNITANLKTLTESVAGVSGLKGELLALSEAMRSFQGISINLTSGKNPVQQMSQYGQSARQTISELKAQATELEQFLQKYYNVSDRAAALMKTISGTNALQGKNIFSILGDINNPNLSMTKQMDAWKEYIALMQKGASIKGIDLTPVTSQFNKNADEMVSGTRKILTGEQQVEAGTEKLKSIFGSGVNSEALISKLEEIRLSIERITTSLTELNSKEIKIKVDEASINSIKAEITQLVTQITEAAAKLNVVKTTKKTSSSSTSTSTKSQYQEASKAIKEYYSLLTELSKTETDITKVDGNYVSPSGKWEKLAASLNRVAAAFETLTGAESRNTMTSDEQAKLTQQLAAAEDEYQRKLEASTNKSEEAAARKEREAAAAEEAARAKREEAEAVKAAKAAQEEETRIAREAEAAKKAAESTARNYNNAVVQGESALKRWSAAAHSGNESSRRAYQALVDSFNELKNAQKLYGDKSKEVDEATKNFRNTLKSTQATLTANGDATQSLTDKVGGLAKKFGSWLTVSQVIMYAYRTVKKMISVSIELDSAMTQMQIVTKAASDEMKNFGNEAAKSAQKTASSITDIVDSATTFARLGYDMQDSTKLAEYTAMLKNVGDIDVSDAQDAITSIIKAYDKDASEIESIMDKLVETGNNFPISVSQIAEGMNNASSTLAASGNTFEQSVALLTAANTTIQDASKSSTGLRTIAARIRNTKTELDDLGEVMTKANYEELVSNLTDAGVRLTDINGEYRSTYDIMSDIAAKWDEMSNTEQAAMATALSGTRQQAVFYSIIEQFKEASGAMDAMTGSAGALDRAYSTYLDSTQAHINQLKAKFEELSTSVMDSNSTKAFIDALGTILDRLNDIVNVTGAIPPLLATISGYLSFKKNFGILKPLNDDFTSAIDNTTTLTNRVGAFGRSLKDIRAVYSVEGWSGVKNMFANTSESIVTSRDIDMLKSYNVEVAAGVDPTVALKNNMIGASKGAISLAEKAGKAGVDIQSLKVSADSASTSLMGARIAATAFNMAITMGISFAITKIIELCNWLANLHDTQQKNAEDEAANAQQKATDADNELKDIQSLIDKYKELAAKGKVSFANRDEAREVQEKITKLVGSQAENLDLVNGKLDEQLKKLKVIYDISQENTTSSYRRAYSKSLDSVTSSQYGDWNWIQKLANDWGGSSGKSIYIADVYTESTFNDTVKRINDMYEKLAIQDAEASGTFNDFVLRLPEKIGDRIDALDAAIKAMETQPDYKENKIWQSLNDYREEMFGKIHSTENSMIDLVNNLTQTSVKDNDGSDFKSVEDYIAYRDSIIKKITSDTDVKDAIDKGLLSTETVTKQVDMYLSTLDQFETYYNEWYQKFGSDTIKGINNIKSQFSKNVGANGTLLFPQLNQPLINGASGQSPSLLIPEITPEQTEAMKTAKEFSDWIDNLSSKDQDLVYNISLNTDTAEWQLDDWKKKLSEAKSGAEKAASKLPSIFSSKDSDNDKTFSDRIKTYRENINSLTEALEKYKKGELDEDTYHGLVEKFPQLAGRTKDLDVAITELMDDMDSDMVSDFDDQFGKLETQEDIDALKEYESQVLSTRKQNSAFAKSYGEIYDKIEAVRHQAERWNELTNGNVDYSKRPLVSPEKMREVYPEFDGEIATTYSQSYTIGEGQALYTIEITPILEDGTVWSEEAVQDYLDKLVTDKGVDGLLASDDLNLIMNVQPGDYDEAYWDDYQSKLGVVKETHWELIKQLQDETGLTWDEIVKKYGVAIDAATKFNSKIEETVSAFNTVKSVVNDYNENGFLSLENVQSILSLSDKYILALTNEQGALDLSTESYKRLVEAELLELKAQALQDSIDSVNKIENEAQALAYLEGSKTDATQASLSLADAQWQEALSAAAVKDIENGTGDLYQRTVIAARKAYETKIALIDKYAETAFTVGELSTATEDYTKALNKEKDALEDSKKALENQKKALEDTKQGYEDALSAVKDLVSWVQDYIKQIKNDEIDALEKKKETIDELIESQKELLDAEKEEYEWNKTIAEKQNTVAKDALAASIASLDDSSAGRKAQKQANDKLAESRTDIHDTLYEHEIEQRKEALDKLKEEQDDYYDNLIKEIQDYLSDEVRLYKDACAMIDNDSGDLYDKLLWYCQNHTTTTEAEFNHMWNAAQSAMQQYNTANLSTFELLNNLQGRIYEVDAAIDTVAQSISSYESAIDGVQSKLDDLSKQAQRTIADVRAAADAENNWAKAKWEYDWEGHTFKSFKENRDDAIQDILHQIDDARGFKGVFPASAATIYGTIRKKYASGTNSAVGGLSLVGERGAELRVLNPGDGILKNQIVRGLTSLGTNPAQFIADAGQMLIKNLFGNGANPSFGAISNNNQIAPNININIQGDATQATVNALKAAVSDIASKVKKDIMGTPLKYKRLI